jgi:hypothetical protein
MTHQTPTDRMNQIAKRPVNALLRDRDATYDQLANAWRALAETVRGEQLKEGQNA